MRIQQIDEATLLAYLEETLDATQRARVSAALQAEPTLRARLDSLQRLRSGLRATFNAVDYLPSPHATIWERFERRTRRRWPGWYSFGVAVSVVLIGVILGRDVFASILPVFKFVSGQPAPGTILQEPTSAIPSDGDVQQPALPIRGTLAYIRDDALWVKQLSDSFERHIDEDAEINTPRWSSSTQWLAYRKGDQIWVSPSSGGDTRVVHDGADLSSFAWSPVADLLAYATADGRLHVLDINEWRAQEISGDDRLPAWMPPIWSPDGEWLAYSVVEDMFGSESDQEEQPLGGRITHLTQVHTDGSEVHRLFSSNVVFGEDSIENGVPAGARLVEWTTDGSIIFWNDLFSGSLMMDGTSLHDRFSWVDDPPREAPVAGRKLIEYILPKPDFVDVASDGSALVAAAGSRRETWVNKHVVFVDLESAGAIRLTGDDVAAISPTWSPDNQAIAYVAGPNVEADMQNALATRRIWVMDRDGANQLRITNDSNYRDERPIWLNSDQLLFARLDHQAQGSLWIVQRDGSDLTQVIADLQPFEDVAGFEDPQIWSGAYGYIDWDRFFAVAPVEQAP